MPNFVTIGSGVSKFLYPQFLPFSIGIAGRPYNSVSTTVLHCNRSIELKIEAIVQAGDVLCETGGGKRRRSRSGIDNGGLWRGRIHEGTSRSAGNRRHGRPQQQRSKEHRSTVATSPRCESTSPWQPHQQHLRVSLRITRSLCDAFLVSSLLFSFFVWGGGSCASLSWTPVSFWAHVNIPSRIVSCRIISYIVCLLRVFLVCHDEYLTGSLLCPLLSAFFPL